MDAQTFVSQPRLQAQRTACLRCRATSQFAVGANNTKIIALQSKAFADEQAHAAPKSEPPINGSKSERSTRRRLRGGYLSGCSMARISQICCGTTSTARRPAPCARIGKRAASRFWPNSAAIMAACWATPAWPARLRGLRQTRAVFHAAWDRQSKLAREGGLRLFRHPQDCTLRFPSTRWPKSSAAFFDW